MTRKASRSSTGIGGNVSSLLRFQYATDAWTAALVRGRDQHDQLLLVWVEHCTPPLLDAELLVVADRFGGDAGEQASFEPATAVVYAGTTGDWCCGPAAQQRCGTIRGCLKRRYAGVFF
jgi:hypothetical protein